MDREINLNDANNSTTTLGDLIIDESFKEADYSVIKQNTKLEINTVLNTLKPRDKRIMIALFGLDGNQPMSLKEVGDEIGITREMIRQIKNKCLVKLKSLLKNSTARYCQ